jgi:hypothetical protein
LTVHAGTGALAVAVLDASGLDCAAADGTVRESGAAELHLLPLGAAASWHGALARLAIYHDRALPADTTTLAPCFARAALLLVGDRCAQPGCAEALASRVRAAARSAQVGWTPATGEWDVRVRLDGGPELHVRRTVGAQPVVLAREVDGQPLVFAPLVINGAPVALGP